MYIQEKVLGFTDFEEQKLIVKKIDKLFKSFGMRVFFKRLNIYIKDIELLKGYENYFNIRITCSIKQENDDYLVLLKHMVMLSYFSKVRKRTKIYFKNIKNVQNNLSRRGQSNV